MRCLKMMLSIIVPFYNAVSTLRSTVESLQLQTFPDIEILLIDDGSTDDGYVTAKDMARYDSRIRVFHQENRGVSSARNHGLDMALGRYVTFVDADDLVENIMYEELMSNLLYSKVDVCVTGIEANGVPVRDLPKDIKFLKGKKEIQGILIGNILWSPDYRSTIMPSACRLIIDRRLLEDNTIRFDTRLGFHEDFVFLIETLLKVNTACIDDRPFYKYVYKKKERKKRHSLSKMLESHKYIIGFLEALPKRSIDDIQRNIHFGLIRFITSVCENTCLKHSNSLNQQIIQLKKFYQELPPPDISGYMNQKTILFKNRLLFWLLSRRFFLMAIMVCWAVRFRASFRVVE
nr:glycosyltransferase [uncultured Desulfobacter sp.]